MEEAVVGLQAGAAQSTLDHPSCAISNLYIWLRIQVTIMVDTDAFEGIYPAWTLDYRSCVISNL
jgi:hypothetical protein